MSSIRIVYDVISVFIFASNDVNVFAWDPTTGMTWNGFITDNAPSNDVLFVEAHSPATPGGGFDLCRGSFLIERGNFVVDL